MPDYRRYFVPGGTYFFTLVSFGRRPRFAHGADLQRLREAVAFVQRESPFTFLAAVVLLFRGFVRRPGSVSQEDPPGVRTIVTFSGTEPELFQDDKQDKPLVGVRLFRMLCDGLAGGEVAISSRGTIQNAQRAECVVGIERFALVLEWIDQTWVASIEWVPETAAEKRWGSILCHYHLHGIFSSPSTTY